MKKLTLLISSLLILVSCNPKIGSSTYNSTKFHSKKIAILPFEIHTSVKQLPEGVTIAMLEKSEQQKAKVMQRDLYRYLLRELAKSERKVTLQDVNETNRIFQKERMSFDEIFDMPKKELAKILKVDAVLYGNIYQYKQKLKLDEEELVKFGGSNNKISTVLYVYGKRRGRIQWKYDKSQTGFPSDYGPEVVKGLLRKAARNFPF